MNSHFNLAKARPACARAVTHRGYCGSRAQRTALHDCIFALAPTARGSFSSHYQGCSEKGRALRCDELKQHRGERVQLIEKQSKPLQSKPAATSHPRNCTTLSTTWIPLPKYEQIHRSLRGRAAAEASYARTPCSRRNFPPGRSWLITQIFLDHQPDSF